MIGLGLGLTLHNSRRTGGALPSGANILRNAEGTPVLNADGEYIYYLN